MDIFFYILKSMSLIVLCYMTLWFILAVAIKRNDVADIAWGLGFIFVAIVSLLPKGLVPFFDRGLFVTTLVCVWGVRLSVHIFRRNVHKPEDRRYAAWRESWGAWFLPRSYLQVFVLQGFLLLLISTPVLMINTYRGGDVITFFDILGLLIWLTGFIFEHVGDRQLKTFISNPENKGKVLSTGLWKYTRHPNYFGEVTQWWGIWVIALSVLITTPASVTAILLSIIGPLTITFLILKVSGIPMLEKNMATNPVYDEYRRTTSVFFPRKPNIS